MRLCGRQDSKIGYLRPDGKTTHIVVELEAARKFQRHYPPGSGLYSEADTYSSRLNERLPRGQPRCAFHQRASSTHLAALTGLYFALREDKYLRM